VPGRFAERGYLHAGIDDTAFSLGSPLEWAELDERADASDADETAAG
jgi:hypothetical protein